VKYALLIYSSMSDEEWEALPEEERSAIYGEYGAVSESPGVVGGYQLQPAATATTVRVQNGKTLTTDGPFAETKEVLGGLFVVEADDIDTALALAERIPAARHGSVEVRPLVEM
jgi:hypothetical protein